MSRVRTLESIDEVAAKDWNALDAQGIPFLSHEFLSCLESTGCVGPGTGWTPRHLLLEADGKVLGAMPLYEKSHSWGEFVFDFSWAQAYSRLGDRYYPKLVSATPFTPATGPRLLAHPDAPREATRAALIAAARELLESRGESSLHVQFASEDEAQWLTGQGFLPRLDCQFHWLNRNYPDFEGFLQSFSAEKRKKARRERRRVEEAGIRFEFAAGADLDRTRWRSVYALHALTFHRHGHEPYLSPEFFLKASERMPGQPVVCLALHGRELIAAAIFFSGRDTLYGRYWGAKRDYHSLHFETCYHQGIEYAIAHGLKRFEPGTQGEHKLARGFTPAFTYSAHFIRDPRYRSALAHHLREETSAVREYAAAAHLHLPFRRPALEEPLSLIRAQR
jgi:predicted N-acyltransferase